MTTTKWQEGDRVQASLPFGQDGVTVAPGLIDRIQIPGPNNNHPERTHRVSFDDPLIYGGLGRAWFNPVVLTNEGDTPAEPERYSDSL